MEPLSSSPERSKRLHNFTLPFRWGQQRSLRCVKLLSPPFPSPTPDHEANRSVPGDEKLKGAINGDDIIAVRPWNLRTRRAACSEPGDESASKVIESFRRYEIGVKRGIDEVKEKNMKVKFSVSLLREEIEEDFSTMIGKRPPRRPKKRPRIVQKQLNSIFPGSWLTEEVTIESYNVPEALQET